MKALPPFFMPPVYWWVQYTKCNRIATFFYYQKQTYLNRMEVKGPHKIERITIPIIRRELKQSFLDVEIIYGSDEKRRLLQTLRCAYGKSAFFIYYFDELEAILNANYTHLHTLNCAVTSWLAVKFKLPEPQYFESSFNEIEPWFDKSRIVFHSEYYQTFGKFVPNLSGLDLLMNLGPDANGFLNHTSLKE
jgi:hypothetical protein